MFNTVSMTGVGAIVTILVTVLKLLGVELPAEAGGQITEAIGTLLGIVLLVWGQLRRDDLVAGIIRK